MRGQLNRNRGSINFGIYTSTAFGKKYVFLPSSVVPAAKGYVKMQNDKNKNYVISLSTSNLAEVTRLQPPKLTYVIWMVTDQGKTENIGQLKSSSKLLSKALTASFKTVTSSKPIKIFISAENDGSAQYPGEQIILTTNVF